MKMHLVGGVPSEADYISLIASDGFREMEIFSDGFLLKHRATLRRYARKWVGDPLHQWSRQWEYPFVFSCLESGLTNIANPRVLDAGSGLTFFPFYVKQKIESAKVNCCDSDESLAAIYRAINDGAQNGVEFSRADMRKTPYENVSFDAIYCISVLEHTNNYQEIIDDFHRILKPGGTLIVTFDISLDGTRDISPADAAKLIEVLNQKFGSGGGQGEQLKKELSIPGVFTTASAKKINAQLLPWKYPEFFYRIKALMAGKEHRGWPPLLSAYCWSSTKPRD